MLEVRHLTKTYNDNNVVDDISFSVPEGKLMVLLGESGCGKTTTLKLINRLIKPTSGKVLINNQDISTTDPVKLRRGIGYVIQNSGLFPHMTVEENVAAVPRLLKWDKEKIKTVASDLLDLLELPVDQYAARLPSELSGGQQQRVAIARALAANPSLLLMDEPFGALDPIIRSQVRESFRKLSEKYPKTVVLVTHDVEEAIVLGDIICLMKDGKVQQMGSPKALVFQPENNFVKSFFSNARFQLELKALSIKDILPYHHAVKEEVPEPIKSCETDNLLAKIEALSNAPGKQLVIEDSIGQIKARASRTSLLNAFEDYKLKGDS